MRESGPYCLEVLEPLSSWPLNPDGELCYNNMIKFVSNSTLTLRLFTGWTPPTGAPSSPVTCASASHLLNLASSTPFMVIPRHHVEGKIIEQLLSNSEGRQEAPPPGSPGSACASALVGWQSRLDSEEPWSQYKVIYDC